LPRGEFLERDGISPLKTSQEGYVILRSEAQKLLADSEELAAVALPATVEEMREKEEDVIASIMEPLSQLRSRVGGDVLPLTIFMMTHCICRGIFFTAFDDKESWFP
jgi:hypothetical protein